MIGISKKALAAFALASVSIPVDACGGGAFIFKPSSSGLHKRADEGFTGCVTPEPLTCEILGTCPYANHSTSPWSVEDNIRQMQLADDAYNARDLARINHRDDTIVYMPGELVVDMAQHLQGMLNDIAAFPDQKAGNHPYHLTFGEGNWTVALTTVTATNTGPIRGPSGWRSGTGRSVNFEALTVAYWEEGRIIREHIWMDLITMNRQLGFFNSPISTEPTVSLSISAETLPLSTNTEVDASAENKARHENALEAFNQGKFDAESFSLSSNVSVFTSREDSPNGLSLNEFIDLVNKLASPFSDLKLSNQQFIGSGDWTASVSRLSGSLNGSLNVPSYISPVPIQSNGTTFEVWFYTIARWQDGEITHLKIMTDPLAVINQL